MCSAQGQNLCRSQDNLLSEGDADVGAMIGELEGWIGGKSWTLTVGNWTWCKLSHLS